MSLTAFTLYIRQKPVELDRLVEIAKIQSTEASNRTEVMCKSVFFQYERRIEMASGKDNKGESERRI
jgi:hypothetical protein